MASSGLSATRTRSMVSMSWVMPSRARNSHWTGTRTESAATRALIVSNPSEGGQSMMVKS